MSTLKSINVQHPSATTINIVNDSSGNVTAGANLTVTGTSTLTGNVLVGTITGSGRITSKTTTTDNTTYPLYMQNSAGSVVGFFRSDGNFNTGALSNAPYNNTTTAAPNLYVSSSGDVLRSTAVVGGITQGTAVASTSGVSIDFTSIPSSVKRITLIFNEVSTSGSAGTVVQLGTGATPTYTNTGYVSTSVGAAPAPGVTSYTNGFGIRNDNAAYVMSGNMVLTNISGTIWISSHVTKVATNVCPVGGGSVTLGAVLTAVRFASANGTDTFDAGSVNIFYE